MSHFRCNEEQSSFCWSDLFGIKRIQLNTIGRLISIVDAWELETTKLLDVGFVSSKYKHFSVTLIIYDNGCWRIESWRIHLNVIVISILVNCLVASGNMSNIRSRCAIPIMTFHNILLNYRREQRTFPSCQKNKLANLIKLSANEGWRVIFR